MPIARRAVSALPVLGLFAASTTAAQGVPSSPEHQLEVIGGLGFSWPMEDTRDGSGSGGFATAEYVFFPRHVVSPRLYAGAVVTLPDDSSCTTPSLCDIEAQIAFAGAKLRIMAPIPWVAPYLEIGLGASAGYMRTHDGTMTDETLRGVAFHVPVALGLALGRNHEYSFAFSYLLNPAQKQTVGAVAVGLTFDLP